MRGFEDKKWSYSLVFVDSSKFLDDQNPHFTDKLRMNVRVKMSVSAILKVQRIFVMIKSEFGNSGKYECEELPFSDHKFIC